ncbi:MAG TPA: cbb3-type cytochrome c oxidase subunit I [Hypericibacter adhaerens]|uniref:nitric-oxide reductase large subunit n=1 Tax=Hypericibacter adhaerens TaxID=2602016 RepID=UPI002C000884|nr:cbb3-type cytochrome c oxidase subunit I [Hypericibacter adhaerens]HWA42765.1 cbb3-type cytochrome c oxidase subunit I [Hypericibacter adhaerens]
MIAATSVNDRSGKDPVSNVLKWILLAVGIVTFALLGWTTDLTYKASPPFPDRFVGTDGTLVMSAADIQAGKAGFQKADLMDYGSLYGMGSYFGEDYTASNLVRLATLTEANIAKARTGKAVAELTAEEQASVRAAMQVELQGIDLSQSVAVLPDAVASAIATLRDEIAAALLRHDFDKGWTQAYSLDEESAARTADFLIYSSLTTVARRPGTTVSWTQNWPFEPLVGNAPTTSTFRWTWISFCFTFFAFGAVLFIYERYLNGPDQAPMDPVLAKFAPLTPSQRRIWKYFLVVAAVLLLQILVGSIMAHYYSDRTSFYGIEVDRFLPFNFLRDVHIQSPIVWIGLSWIGAGLFLAPAISGGEPKGQGFLVDLLFWVTLLIVVGALAGNYLGIMGYIREGWFWFGNQGLSYIQLGRAWQIGFFAGLAIWSLLVLRALWPSGAKLAAATRQFWTGRIKLEHLIWASTVNIALLYACGMIPLTGIEKSFTITDFWRWWVVHLWVEQSFEFFAAAISAYLLMAVGLVSRQLAERSVYFELILIFLGGVLGTGHHLYWAGAPGLWVPLGTMFSFIEVLPLVLLVIEAIQHHRLIKTHGDFKYGLAYIYIIGAAFWNFVGAGVFGGGTLNAPLVNYYEHGTFLTLNHAHTALFGAFGLLGIGLVYFCLRYAAGEIHAFGETVGRWAFWLYNGGLVLWILFNFFPIGWPQLDAVYEHGLAYARSQAFYDGTAFWQWMRFPGDVVFALGALLMAWDFIVKSRPLLPRFALRLLPGGRARQPAAAE